MNLILAGVPIQIAVTSSVLQPLLESNFSHLVVAAQPPVLTYQLTQVADGYVVQEGERLLYQGKELADVLFYLEKDLIISAQLKTQDHLFFHAAALTYQGKTLLFAGGSGAGKSSVCWALLQHGYQYLSDELVPVLPGKRVYPFQRAVNHKRELAAPYGLPESAVNLGRYFILPVDKTQCEVNLLEKIDYVFLVQFNAQEQQPAAHAISGADALVLLYQHVLNAKSFADFGMQGLAKIVRSAQSYQLRSVTDMQATVSLITDLVSGNA